MTIKEALLLLFNHLLLFPDQDVPDDEGRTADGQHAGGLHQDPDGQGCEQ